MPPLSAPSAPPFDLHLADRRVPRPALRDAAPRACRCDGGLHVRADDYCWTCILLMSGLGHQARQTPSGGCLEPRNQHAQVVTTHLAIARIVAYKDDQSLPSQARLSDT